MGFFSKTMYSRPVNYSETVISTAMALDHFRIISSIQILNYLINRELF